MRLLLKSLFVATGLIGLSGAAVAADAPKPPPVVKPIVVAPAAYNWNGLYLGINGGGGWGQADRSNSSVNEFSISGPFVGGQIGWNVATGGLVWGVEADAQWSGIDGLCNGVCGVPQLTVHDINWFATARARLGMATGPGGNLLWYVTGGWAWANATRESSAGNQSVTASHSGWVAGAGVEWGFAAKVTAKVEYQYLALNAQLYDFPIGIDPTVRLPTHTVRFGLNWHL
jgi:outer membrane immunogenic protein